MNKPPLFDLTGKVALVTGASHGIGESIARLLAAQGAHVIISSRKTDACETVTRSILDSGGSAETMPCHIGEMEQISNLFANIRESQGKLDILVNNAATNPYFGPILETDPGVFQKTMDVNVRGYFFMSTTAAKLMKESGGGSIVNVASVNGIVPGGISGNLLHHQGCCHIHDKGLCERMCRY